MARLILIKVFHKPGWDSLFFFLNSIWLIDSSNHVFTYFIKAFVHLLHPDTKLEAGTEEVLLRLLSPQTSFLIFMEHSYTACPFSVSDGDSFFDKGLFSFKNRRIRGEWDVWMASLTLWTWVWARSGSWWWTGKPGVLQSMESQRVRHDWVTELNWRAYWNPGGGEDCYCLQTVVWV